MVSIDFPNSPIVGQTFTSGERSWRWSGITWDSVAVEYSYISAVAPLEFNSISNTLGIDQSQIELSISQITDYVAPENWNSITTSSSVIAVKDTNYFVNTSNNGIVVTLPSSALPGDEIHIFDANGNAETNSILVQAPTSKIAGAVQDLEIDVNYAAVVLIYINTAYGWRVN